MAERPPWLTRFAEVTGTIRTAPLDLPTRFDRVTSSLQAAGWTVVVRDIGTDFSGPLGLPVPKSQPLTLLLHRRDRAYTEREAEQALEAALRAVSLDYSPIGAWLRELSEEVIEPTIERVQKGTQLAVTAGIVAIVLVLLLRK